MKDNKLSKSTTLQISKVQQIKKDIAKNTTNQPQSHKKGLSKSKLLYIFMLYIKNVPYV